jgi:LuxR family maltose regulon positive regulatory protein
VRHGTVPGEAPPHTDGGLWPAEAKLRPAVRLVNRAPLLAHLLASHAPVVLVSAPAGYGKTTALTQWVDVESRKTAWLQLDDGDNDPLIFLTCLVAALSSVAPVNPTVAQWLELPAPPVRENVLPALAAAEAGAEPFLLVIDDGQSLTNEVCWALLGQVLTWLPATAQIAIGTRSQPQLPLARLRAAGLVLEIGPTDLAMDVEETGRLLRLAGIAVDDDTVEALQVATEGWAAGVYLAALAHNTRNPQEWLAGIQGPQRNIAGYLTAEVLDRQPPVVRDFLIQTSILEQLCAPLCAAVTRAKGAAELLNRLTRDGLFVASLDDTGEWYRYHHLFASLLRHELDDRLGSRVGALHRRAALWQERHGRIDEALRHWLAAGEVDRAALLVGGSYTRYAGQGRVETVRRWFELFSDDQILSSVPLTLLAGWVYTMTGDARTGRLWSTAALSERVDDSPSPDGAASLRSSQAALRASIAPDGVARMKEDAQLAVSLEADGNPAWRASANVLLGIASWLSGDRRTARRSLHAAASEGYAFNAIAEIGALGHLSLLCADEGRWDEAESYVVQGERRMAETGFGHYVPTVSVVLGRARVLAHTGDPGAAARVEAVSMLLGQSVTVAWVTMMCAVILAEVSLQGGDVGVAARWVAVGSSTLATWPDAGILADRLKSVSRALQARRTQDPLTPAELRVLELLRTQLTRDEIARQLLRSRSTVKTQIAEIYRKLGVHTRTRAIERARELDLIT